MEETLKQLIAQRQKLLDRLAVTGEMVRKGKAGKPNEFGKMVKLQEAESQIVIGDVVYDQGFRDCGLPVPAIATHQQMLGRTPHLLAADAGFYSAKNEAVAQAEGIKRVCIPNRLTKSPEREREQNRLSQPPPLQGDDDMKC